MSEGTRFQPGFQFEVFNRHGLRYVLIGGVAARLHGSIRKTGDVDICPEPTGDNAERLVDALSEMTSKIYVDDDSPALPFSADASSLLGLQLINVLTKFGRLDIVWNPPGTDGYGDLIRDAVVMDVFGHEVRVASIDALIRSKGAIDRPKDREVIADLAFIRDRGTPPSSRA
jgi:hypothetical protein